MNTISADAQNLLAESKTPFIHNGIRYISFIQYLSHQKALWFGDIRVADQVMRVSAPMKQRQLGNKVQGYVAAAWAPVCGNVIFEGLKSKFLQHPALSRWLLDRSDAELMRVECACGISCGVDYGCRSGVSKTSCNPLDEALVRVRELLKMRRAA
ncbi:conserved hypothetical protein, ribA/ribD-fused [Noviherbaspirillum humi]|uniref:NADAR domain-containing protein n=1 Tax=Noviherbaspirillum humi TaxID=1688639 RepID=A0A239HFN0_9BURK|nr:NADAR domain-containing protein [Noviherbaspirillum humi]SNS79858.1 conserved hypothetical protein, ribA/ribD-fused [Noviherbaspirillum humi]